MTGTMEIWAICAIRDTIRDHNPDLWRKIRYASLKDALPLIEQEYGIALKNKSLESTIPFLLALIGEPEQGTQQ